MSDSIVWPTERPTPVLHVTIQRDDPGRSDGPRLLPGRHDTPRQDLAYHSHPTWKRPPRRSRRLWKTVAYETGFVHRRLQDVPDHPNEVDAPNDARVWQYILKYWCTALSPFSLANVPHVENIFVTHLHKASLKSHFWLLGYNRSSLFWKRNTMSLQWHQKYHSISILTEFV